MAVGIRSQQFRDPMAAQRQRRVWLVRTIWGIVFVVIAGAGVWAGNHFHLLAKIAQYFQKPAAPAVERQAIGTWCRDAECQFFDRLGERWGEALQSSGPLLLLVQDKRPEDIKDKKLFANILTAAEGLVQFNLAAKSVTLPDAEPGGMTITTTKGYDLYFDALGNVADQLSVLGIFLADQAKNTSFAPQYIDLRTPGRVYYK